MDNWSSWVVRWTAHKIQTTIDRTRFRCRPVNVRLPPRSTLSWPWGLTSLQPGSSNGPIFVLLYGVLAVTSGRKCTVIAVMSFPNWGANAGAARATSVPRATCNGPLSGAGQHAPSSLPAQRELPAA